MKVTTGNNISVHYEGKLSDGTIFDSSRERDNHITFEVGSRKLIPGFSTAVIGMTEGETKNFTIACYEAYGQRDETSMQVVPKNAFAEDFDFKVGGVIKGNGPMGPFMAKIREIKESEVLLDFNHPLAGHDLTFEVEVMSIEEGEVVPNLADEPVNVTLDLPETPTTPEETENS